MQGAFPRPWLLARHQKLSLEKFSHAGPVAIGNTPVFFFATKAEPAFGALRVIVAADLARGTGRFNLIQGLIATGVAIRASFARRTAVLGRGSTRAPCRFEQRAMTCSSGVRKGPSDFSTLKGISTAHSPSGSQTCGLRTVTFEVPAT